MNTMCNIMTFDVKSTQNIDVKEVIIHVLINKSGPWRPMSGL